jgi:hypothetical protein
LKMISHAIPATGERNPLPGHLEGWYPGRCPGYFFLPGIWFTADNHDNHERHSNNRTTRNRPPRSNYDSSGNHLEHLPGHCSKRRCDKHPVRTYQANRLRSIYEYLSLFPAYPLAGVATQHVSTTWKSRGAYNHATKSFAFAVRMRSVSGRQRGTTLGSPVRFFNILTMITSTLCLLSVSRRSCDSGRKP